MATEPDTYGASTPIATLESLKAGQVSALLEHSGIRYMLFVPSAWQRTDANSKKHPVILFLHGGGCCNNEQGVRGSSFAKQLSQPTADQFPFIAVLPVATPGPPSLGWMRGTCFQSYIDLVDMITADLGGDPCRIYALGESMGGGGVWALAGTCPERFAAIVPCAGHLCCDGRKTGQEDVVIANLLNKPIWVFHSADDDIAPVEESDQAVKALTDKGSNVKYTRYANAGHGCWKVAYDDEEFWSWLLQQKLL